MRVVRKTNLVVRAVEGDESDDSNSCGLLKKRIVRVVGGGESDDSNLCALLEKRIWWFALLEEASLMTQTCDVVRKTNLVVRVVEGDESDDSNSCALLKNESGGSRCWRRRD